MGTNLSFQWNCASGFLIWVKCKSTHLKKKSGRILIGMSITPCRTTKCWDGKHVKLNHIDIVNIKVPRILHKTWQSNYQRWRRNHTSTTKSKEHVCFCNEV